MASKDFAEIRLQDEKYAPILCRFCALFNFCAQSGIAGVSLACSLTALLGLKHATMVGILYGANIKTSRSPYSGDAKNKSFRQWTYWKMLASYFPHTLIRTDSLRHKRVIFCVHPHGVMSLSVPPSFAANSNDVDALFPHLDIRVAIVNAPFYYPIGREMALLAGCISADKPSIVGNLTQGKSVVIVVGGADEALLAGSGAMRLVLKDRMGFVKTAVITGTPLVPVLAFGENDTYRQVFSKNVRKMQGIMQRIMGFSLPMFYSLPFAVIPRRVPLNTVIGSAIECPQCLETDPRFVGIVREVHSRYVAALQDLHAQYAPRYGAGDDQRLEILTVAEARNPNLARDIRHSLAKL